jgi:Mg2+ and Co2+ transporter CorA
MEAQKYVFENWGWLVFIGYLCANLIEISPVKIYPLKYIKTKIRKCIKNFIEEIIKDVLDNITNNIETLSNEIGSIKSNMTECIKEQKLDKIKRLRKEILDFSDQLMRNDGNERQKNAYELILFDYYPEYERLLEDFGDKNGIVTDAINYIEKKYHEHRENNDFIL